MGNIVSNGTISDSDTAGDRLNVVISGTGSVQIGGPITTGTDVLGAGSVNITGQLVTFTAAGDISAGTTGAVAITSQGTKRQHLHRFRHGHQRLGYQHQERQT